MRTSPSAVCVLGLALLCDRAVAHQPILSDGSATTPEAAIELRDVQISRVIYHEVTAEAPQVWMAFDVSEPQFLKVTLGVPDIERLAAYRPALALIGPGLPPADLPAGSPPGLGGVVFDTRAVTEPEYFNEPFSGTQSWIVFEQELELPEAGRYYLVAYSPTNEAGKLWVAPGVKEVFSAADFGSLAGDLGDVRAFHEVSAGAALPCVLFPLGLAVAGVWLVRTRAATRRPGAAE